MFCFQWQITIIPLMNIFSSLTVFIYLFILLALPSSIHLKNLTKFYSIYLKVSHKISAQSDGRIENYIQ
jgi:hypothetical protein